MNIPIPYLILNVCFKYCPFLRQVFSFKMTRFNENLSKAEQWQECAHEVCHLLRHSGNQTVLAFPFINCSLNLTLKRKNLYTAKSRISL